MRLDFASLEAVSALVVVIDPACSVLHWNAACYESTGVPLAQARGQSIWKLLRPLDGIEPDAIRCDDLAGAEPFECDLMTSRGASRRISWSGRALRDEHGELEAVVLTGTDTGSERASRQRERLLNGIFEILPVGVWIADETGRIVRANAAALRIWAGARYVNVPEFGEYKGWWADTGQPIAAEEWALARALTKGETSVGELVRIQCFDGTFKTVINSALPLYDDEGKFAGAIVVNEDVTHLRAIEDALRQAVRTRDELLGIVAHDLRNPLAGILMQLELLQESCAPESGQDSIAAIRRQALRINRLIEDLVDVARIDAGVLSIHSAPVPARSLIEEAMETQRAVAAPSLEFCFDAGADLPEVCADRERVLQVLDNLIGNAVKFTRPGGRVRIGALPRGGDVLFWVSDTGVGIASEHLPHLFDRFWQVMRTGHRGAGLGLAIAKGIVEAHDGRIWAESQLGEGSTFYFTLKVAHGAQPATGQAGAAARS